MYTVQFAMQPAYANIDKVVSSALLKDAQYYIPSSSNIEADKKLRAAFVRDNQFGYELAIGSWLCMLSDRNYEVANRVKQQIANYGLIKVIQSASEASYAIIDGSTPAYPWYALDGSTGERLQAVRYLKRFTPVHDIVLGERAIVGYLDVQARLKSFWTHDKIFYVARSYRTAEIRECLGRLLKPFSSVSDFPRFSSGSHIGVGTSLVDKANQLVQCDPDALVRGHDVERSWLNFFGEVKDLKRPKDDKVKSIEDVASIIASEDRAINDHHYGSVTRSVTLRGTTSDYPLTLQRWWTGRDLNIMMSVPKSYKTRRLIAPETTLRQWNASRLARATEENFSALAKKIIPLHDQSRNCKMAEDGSQSCFMATIDQSSASDSISESLFRILFPDWYIQLNDQYDIRAARTVVPGEYYEKVSYNPDRRITNVTWSSPKRVNRQFTVIKNQTHLTSGNSCTFIQESLLFAAIAMHAVEHEMQANPVLHDQLIADYGSVDGVIASCVSVYGDDVCLPSFAATYFMDVLLWLGLKPNMEKSFWGDSHYRESCGEEYLYGTPVHSLYWPRRPILQREDSLESLIALQHRFWSHPVLSDIFARACRRICPKLTVSKPVEDHGDLWSLLPRVIYCKAPFDTSPKYYYDKYRLLPDPDRTIIVNPDFISNWNEAVRLANQMQNPDAAGYVSVPMFLIGTKQTPVDIPSGNLPWSAFIRERHTVLEPKYPQKSDTWFTGPAGQYILRVFLEEGPYFADPLLKLLGVSQPRWSADKLFHSTEHQKVSYRVVDHLL